MSKKKIFKKPGREEIATEELNQRRTLPVKVAIAFTTLTATYLLFSITNLFFADFSYATGRKLTQVGKYDESLEYFEEAVRLNPHEPAYHRDYAYALAKLAEDRRSFVEKAVNEAQIAYQLNPKNSLTLKKLVSVYYALSETDTKYNLPLLQLSLEITKLAPTEPRPHYDQALIFIKLGLKEKAIEAVSKALELKPDYPEAQQLYDLLTVEPKG